MSPTMLHSCLQGPLSGRKPRRDQTPPGSSRPALTCRCGTGGRGTPLLTLLASSLLNGLIHQLLSKIRDQISRRHHRSDTQPRSGHSDRRGGDREQEQERAEQRTFPQYCAPDPSTSNNVSPQLQRTEGKKVSNWLAWGHRQSPQADPPPTSHLLSYTPFRLARPSNPQGRPSQFVGASRGHESTAVWKLI